MPTGRRRRYPVIIALAALLGPCAAVLGAEISVFDQISLVGAPVTLVVRTTHFFVADGGRRVSISLDGEILRPILTGGDGYGYLRLTPSRCGLFKISARSGESEGSGRLWVLKETERIVLLESETVLKEIFLRPGARESCRAALESLQQRYRLIFVYRLLSAGVARRGLEGEGLSPVVLIPWKGAATPESLRAKGLQIHAVIGSAETARSAGAEVRHRISFEKDKQIQTISEWEEIAKALE
jgi:hypothetical protein